ncbi:prepilin peptidase [Pyxidicoccus xibeiensis]|uniref:prepilin peptidase n=1 Tax=Pyxidicoccus xibeiensis TaxID=2906759 RepID=UPI0020A7256D|nr:A24 family peptidase [Pyxidicoccus xibeiensis]MCP3143994.1 prepilin peptidase [Pyxidicoccus xibeiensis]
MVEGFFAAWLFVTGLVVGSFLNVVIARVPLEQSIVRPRSRCPKCGHVLAWYENIPLVSWMALRARCRGCATPISIRYPLVELLTGLLWFACLRRFGWTYELAPALVLVTLLVPLTFIDLDHWILPRSITVSGMFAGLVLAWPRGLDAFWDAVWGLVVGFLAFRLMEYVGWKFFKKEALGAGDKYLVAMLGAFLSWRALLGILLFASLQGAVVGILMLALTGRAGPRGEATEGPEGSDGEAPAGEEPPLTMTWEFTKPGLPLWQRLLLVPVCLLLQPIPDAPLDEEGEEEDWVPDRTSIPFGPWLALAGLEVLLLGPWLSRVLPPEIGLMLGAG